MVSSLIYCYKLWLVLRVFKTVSFFLFQHRWIKPKSRWVKFLNTFAPEPSCSILSCFVHLIIHNKVFRLFMFFNNCMVMCNFLWLISVKLLYMVKWNFFDSRIRPQSIASCANRRWLGNRCIFSCSLTTSLMRHSFLLNLQFRKIH